MTAFTKSEENYIEHEVQLRLHTEQFKKVDRTIRGIYILLFSILGGTFTSILVPILLHTYKLA